MSATSRLKRLESHRLEGNALCKEGKFSDAIDCYNSALRLANKYPEAIPLLLNRSHARNASQQYDSALADAHAVLELSSKNETALFRAARANYGLRRYAEASALLIQLMEVNPSNLAAVKDLKRCPQRLKEESGVYDFAAMLDEAIKKGPAPDMDRASFVGPVEVRQCAIKSHGKGLFTTKSVKAGDLLLVEKAFSAVFPDDGDLAGTPKDPESGLMSKESSLKMRAELKMCTYLKLQRNPCLRKDFARLFPGSDATEEVDPKLGHTVLDEEFVERRILYNAFAFPILSKDFHWRASHYDAAAKANEERDPNGCIGMWIQASFINHSCYPNVRRSFIGDMMIFRAQQDVPADTELKFGYINGLEDYEERQKSLKQYGFTCLCSLCECQRKTSPKNTKLRAKFVADIIESFEKPVATDMEDYHTLLTKIDQTYEYSQREEPRRVFIPLYTSLINACAHGNMPQQVVALGLLLLRALGFEMTVTPSRFEITHWGLMTDELVGVLADMWTAYGKVEPAIVNDVEKIVRTAYCMMAGEEFSFAGAYGRAEPEIEEKGDEDPEMKDLVEEVRRKVNSGGSVKDS